MFTRRASCFKRPSVWLQTDTLPGAVIDVLQGRGKFAKGNKLAPKERQVVWVTCYISSPRTHITSNSYGHLTSRSHTTTLHGGDCMRENDSSIAMWFVSAVIRTITFISQLSNPWKMRNSVSNGFALQSKCHYNFKDWGLPWFIRTHS